MHPSIERLLRVQEVDSQMIFLGEAIRLRPLEVEDDRRKLDESRAAVAAVRDEIKKEKMAVDRRELEVKGIDADIEKLNVALNRAKSNAEYTVLKEQIRRQEGIRGDIEEDVLGKLAEIDVLEAREKELQERAGYAEKAYDRKRKEVDEVVEGLSSQFAELDAKRRELVEGVEKDHLHIYEKVLARYNDFAIARVDGNVCQGCHMAVTPQDINLLLQNEFLPCKSCSRLLYVS